MTTNSSIRTDTILRARIHTAIAAAVGDRSATIGVAVDRGVAILTGFVGTFRDKLTAAECAASVTPAVANEIEVRDPAFHRRDDADVARDCAVAVAALPAGVVRVQVERGCVRLTGMVEGPRDRAAALRAVGRVPGVAGVCDWREAAPPAPIAAHPLPRVLRPRTADTAGAGAYATARPRAAEVPAP